MPNRHVHLKVGTAAGGAYATYQAWGQPGPRLLAETAGGLLGGAAGGLLPDAIDVPLSPRHRAEAHSLSVTGTVGYFAVDNLPSWQASLRNQAQYWAALKSSSPDPFSQLGYGLLELLLHFLSGLLAGVVGGYASHLVLDSFTASSLPLF